MQLIMNTYAAPLLLAARATAARECAVAVSPSYLEAARERALWWWTPLDFAAEDSSDHMERRDQCDMDVPVRPCSKCPKCNLSVT